MQKISEYKLTNPDTHSVNLKFIDVHKQLAQLKESQKYHADTIKITECTPLMLATYRGHVDAVKVLLRAKADIFATDSLQRNIVHWAALTGRIELLQVILAHENAVELINEKDQHGNTSLHLAVQCVLVHPHPFDARNIMTLCNHGANILIKNSDFKSPIDLVESALRLDIVNLLTQQMGRMHRPVMRSVATQTEYCSTDAIPVNPAQGAVLLALDD